MLTQQVILSNKLGLHARATMKLVNTAEQFKSDITICFQNRCVDARNILDLMTLGASCGSPLEMKVSGIDETQALDGVLKLIEERFDEE